MFAAAFAVATVACFWVLLLEPSPFHAARVFWDRTIPSQLNRHSPFSLWDWRQYHAGLPDLHVLQRVLEALLVAGRRRSRSCRDASRRSSSPRSPARC